MPQPAPASDGGHPVVASPSSEDRENARHGSGPLKVLLADNVPQLRSRLRAVLSQRPGLEVTAEAEDGRQAVALAADHQPDVVVLDLGLPDLEGREVLTHIRNHVPSARVVVFSGPRRSGDDWVAERVDRVVSKDEDLGILVEALEAVGRQPVQLATIALARNLKSVRRARDETRRTLTTWGLSPLADDCSVVVSELVTNAVVHAASRCVLRLSNQPRSVRVSVIDFGPGTPEPLAPSEARVGGRGLQIVNALSTAWGVDGLIDGSKIVWAEVRRP